MRVYETCLECGEVHCTTVEGFNSDLDTRSYEVSIKRCVWCAADQERVDEAREAVKR